MGIGDLLLRLRDRFRFARGKRGEAVLRLIQSVTDRTQRFAHSFVCLALHLAGRGAGGSTAGLTGDLGRLSASGEQQGCTGQRCHNRKPHDSTVSATEYSR